MAPFFANRSCDPFLPRSEQCVIGTYVQYAVNVTNPQQIAQAIQFATQHNIRLVIRNTGHDYNGKSTGAGALGIWMHHLKDIEIFDYNSSTYSGKAIKMGAGVQGFEAYEAAHAQGLAVVSGECPTVGIAGGYTQGGGHSALASKYGLAADQTLEWELVTGTGEILTANREGNSDLYWALSGGGGGTYGVTTSLTSKAHPDIPMSGANLSFSSQNLSQDDYYNAIEAYHALLPTIVDAGAMSLCVIDNESFSLGPVTGPGISSEELSSLLKPLVSYLDDNDIQYNMTVLQFDTYLDQFNAMQWPVDVGVAQYGGRLIPRSVVQENNQALTAAVRNITNTFDGVSLISIAVNVGPNTVGQDTYNAVHPAWRDTLIDSVLTTPWNFTAPLDEMIARQNLMTDALLPPLEALTPGGGCYLNEGDFRQPDWQSVFYGTNYDRLLSIKNQYDPNHMFYATTAVGSEYWLAQEDGRLCRS